MPPVRRFEDLVVWQDARALIRDIYRMTGQGVFAKDYGLRDQMRRAAVSILSNIAEGFERGGTKEYIRFLKIAKGSCGEVRAQLYVANDLDYIAHDLYAKLLELTESISCKLYRLIMKLANPKMG